MNTKRISIIDHVGKKAGLDHYDASLAGVLIKKSFQVKIYSNFSNGDQSIVVNHFTFSFKNKWFRFPVLLMEYYAALKLSKKDKAEIIILHIFHSTFIDYLFVRLAANFNFKVCIILHDIDSLVFKQNNSWLNKCLEKSDFIVVHNVFAADELSKKTGNRHKMKIFVTLHGNYIDVVKKINRKDAARYFNLDPDKAYLLFFGMIKKVKGLEILIRAMQNISSDIHLVIAGRTRDVSFDLYSSLTEKLNLSERIHPLIRYITNDERNLLFNLAEAVVIPYHKVYQSGVLLLSMSYGLPVIVSDIQSNKIIIDGKNGLLFNTGDSADLAQKINLLISDNVLKESISKSGKEYVTNYHGWEKVGDDLSKIFN